MEAKYTPGPWWIKPTSRSRLELEIEGVGASVATVYESHTTPNHEDNARLIAAAPDLLDACQIALRLIRAAGIDDRIGAHEIRSAIAKATQT